MLQDGKVWDGFCALAQEAQHIGVVHLSEETQKIRTYLVSHSWFSTENDSSGYLYLSLKLKTGKLKEDN